MKLLGGFTIANKVQKEQILEQRHLKVMKKSYLYFRFSRFWIIAGSLVLPA
jgi:hypothetical protein